MWQIRSKVAYGVVHRYRVRGKSVAYTGTGYVASQLQSDQTDRHDLVWCLGEVSTGYTVHLCWCHSMGLNRVLVCGVCGVCRVGW